MLKLTYTDNNFQETGSIFLLIIKQSPEYRKELGLTVLKQKLSPNKA